jgi:hypothetical protein
MWCRPPSARRPAPPAVSTRVSDSSRFAPRRQALHHLAPPPRRPRGPLQPRAHPGHPRRGAPEHLSRAGAALPCRPKEPAQRPPLSPAPAARAAPGGAPARAPARRRMGAAACPPPPTAVIHTHLVTLHPRVTRHTLLMILRASVTLSVYVSVTPTTAALRRARRTCERAAPTPRTPRRCAQPARALGGRARPRSADLSPRHTRSVPPPLTNPLYPPFSSAHCPTHGHDRHCVRAGKQHPQHFLTPSPAGPRPARRRSTTPPVPRPRARPARPARPSPTPQPLPRYLSPPPPREGGLSSCTWPSPETLLRPRGPWPPPATPEA